MTERTGKFAIQALGPNKAVVEITSDPHPATGRPTILTAPLDYDDMLTLRDMLDKVIASMEDDDEP